MTWWIECSIGGARELGTGLRYIEMMVIPLENCSTYFLAELWGENVTSVNVRGNVPPTDSLKTVKVVKIGQGREELLGSAHLVPNYNPPLPRLFDLEQLDDGSAPLPDLIHDVLINLERLVGSLFQERLVRDGLDIDRFIRVEGRRLRVGKDTSLEEVASELLARGRRDGAGRSVSLETVSLVDRRIVEVVFVDPADEPIVS